MKVLEPVKRVVDFNVKVRVKSDNTGVDIANVKMSRTLRFLDGPDEVDLRTTHHELANARQNLGSTAP